MPEKKDLEGKDPENVPGPKPPAPEIISNLPGQSGPVSTSDEAGEPVDLPSGGKLYPPDNPASKGTVYVRGMTTAEEEILVTERLQRQGIAIDMILSRCIVTKGINTLDLLSGDRTHLLYYLRAISYGPDYKFTAVMSGGHQQEIEANVGELEIKQLPKNFQEPFPFQYKGTTYELRLSRGHDEQAVIQARLQNDAKLKARATEIGGTESLKNLIVSIDGNTDKKFIAEQAKKLPVRTAHAIRQELIRVSPGPVLRKAVVHEKTGASEEVTIAVTESFFRPTD